MPNPYQPPSSNLKHEAGKPSRLLPTFASFLSALVFTPALLLAGFAWSGNDVPRNGYIGLFVIVFPIAVVSSVLFSLIKAWPAWDSASPMAGTTLPRSGGGGRQTPRFIVVPGRIARAQGLPLVALFFRPIHHPMARHVRL